MPLYWILVFPLALLWSGLRPHGGLTWLLDALPAIAAFVALVMTRRRFALTPVSYALLLVLCLLILAGAHYSFSRVPLFNELKPWLGTERNDFDKLAHFFQGFAPALVLREILIRFEVLAKRSWLWVVVVGLSLALSATYELVEWWAALILRERAEDFLAIQGDPWDTQSDMAAALLGALCAVVMLGRLQDRQISRLIGTDRGESPIRGLPDDRRAGPS